MCTNTKGCVLVSSQPLAGSLAAFPLEILRGLTSLNPFQTKRTHWSAQGIRTNPMFIREEAFVGSINNYGEKITAG